MIKKYTVIVKNTNSGRTLRVRARNLAEARSKARAAWGKTVGLHQIEVVQVVQSPDDAPDYVKKLANNAQGSPQEAER